MPRSGATGAWAATGGLAGVAGAAAALVPGGRYSSTATIPPEAVPLAAASVVDWSVERPDDSSF